MMVFSTKNSARASHEFQQFTVISSKGKDVIFGSFTVWSKVLGVPSNLRAQNSQFWGI